ncbi:MAG TPA: tyrosine--tRNA ligase [Polyangiaceae bacterium]|jgi:tyrosyl-tRNA synthetase|nr:MAG: Tyrosine--tRNA ligase [Deltaproteobacteria bacterium ADurb.Bin207]HNS99587.1 tyrosine--tRNA ligase [Polyangiaceae bacterium]HNZ22521.1 tyrosine--tRNA ligase [Polyangiaceae bacterium]HOD22739.1 tyrosine--tRNA ligase [Polyangiaceae bacterium]HOE48527.1 tyrosine--tRNA ligase [Polyangiaceae bacterium]
MAECNVYDELVWRGLIDQATSPLIPDILKNEKVTCYIGFDPSADSLHVGHLLQILLLVRMQQAGHKPIALLGGATGVIGDPSGKSEERNLLDLDRVEHNLAGIRAQLEHFLGTTETGAVTIVNNHDWLGSERLLGFLRDVGKHFSVNVMMSRDSVRSRLTQREQGISFTEFSYMLLQAHDFLHLFDNYGCTFQLGGSDQLGNILGGIDLIRRCRKGQAFGLTSPLLTTADGKKLGKTEKGAVWLDARKTSAYQFYQYWVRSDDRDVIKLLCMLTMRSREEIEELTTQVEQAPHHRQAQQTLARDMTALVHGPQAAVEVERAAQALFGQAIAELNESTLLDVMSEAPSLELPATAFDHGGLELVDLLTRTQLCASKGAARKDISAGGIYVNNRRIQDVGNRVCRSDALHGRYLVLRKGKKNFFLVKLMV